MIDIHDGSYSEGEIEPFTIGAFNANGKQFLPYSLQELERAKLFFSSILASFHFRTGRNLLVISMLDDLTHFLPLERAAMDYGLVVVNADDSFYDAKRVESILRRFDVAAVAAVSSATLDGLESLDFNVQTLFSKAIVWAYPDAMDRLKNCNVRPLLAMGPATAIACEHNNGLHVDQREWLMEEEGGEIIISNRLPRAMNFCGFKTGVKAQIDTGVCACGSSDPRIHLT